MELKSQGNLQLSLSFLTLLKFRKYNQQSQKLNAFQFSLWNVEQKLQDNQNQNSANVFVLDELVLNLQMEKKAKMQFSN